MPNAELQRLINTDQGNAPWKLWGPYLSDRQWGTVREDYSRDGSAWNYFPFEHAALRAYRWGEDGIAGISDDKQRLCLSLALWNGVDPILKERLFGLTNEQGNHGEDVKELYYHLDATPTGSYLKYLYKYPQREFPYGQLREKNRGRSRHEMEYELIDTGLFDDNAYWDVFIEYAFESPRDVLMKITVHNRGSHEATLHVLPQLWFRNTWSWVPDAIPPEIRAETANQVFAVHHEWDDYRCHFDGSPNLLFCDNETNARKLFNSPGPEHPKDSIGVALVQNKPTAVNPNRTGTKMAAHYITTVPGGGSSTFRARLRFIAEPAIEEPFAEFDSIMARRIAEADEYYAEMQKHLRDDDAKRVHRQACAGLIWTKQYFEYDVWQWLKGDPAQPPPPAIRKDGRNHDWEHLKAADILSMPDKWEYPWFAVWDTAFHMVPFAKLDPEFAKHQLLLFLGDRYMHPNGQLPAYEWNFNDTNPPVHAVACWQVYKIAAEVQGTKDRAFLERCFHKLMLNFSSWVNRKDAEGRNIFQGGFLGLDNIGVFDRSRPLPTGGFINQADATGWMAMFSLNLMRIALELAQDNPVYQDMAIKYFEHFLSIARAMTQVGGTDIGLWDDTDKFYYDELVLPDGEIIPMKVRSMVGLIPLFAVEVLEPETLQKVPEFASRLRWILDNRPDLAGLVSRWFEPGRGETRLLSLLRGHRIKCLLRYMLDPKEFLSDYGIRSLSKFHQTNPYTFRLGSSELRVDYTPGESTVPDFGGNSNWRGPIWMPMNFCIILALKRFHHYYGDDFRIEYPVGSGQTITILEAAHEIARRVNNLFLLDAHNKRAFHGDCQKYHTDPYFHDHVQFYEYFDGDTGRGLGASHQCGWTALVMLLLS